ncbi:MAG: hypothetical protein ABEJ79_05535 [Halolamina sp.]
MASWLEQFLSSVSEWHALALGFSVMFLGVAVGGVAELVAFLVLVLGAVADFFGEDTALSREPWYALGGGVVGYLAAQFGVVDALAGLV